jgi:hypothetical protein
MILRAIIAYYKTIDLYLNIIYYLLFYIIFRLTSREGGDSIFSLIQAQNVQVKFLIIFKSGEFLIFVVFFFF